mmetsp:Transcript_27905/g.73609  ORF Transcript_27905/g.73609 Transcript_27905/m.73609 type:complete len:163 (+) Transcript_27905:160-648(+)
MAVQSVAGIESCDGHRIPATHVDQFSNIRSAPYMFKRKHPRPGQYPAVYSPYRLEGNHPIANSVRLSKTEALSDLAAINATIASQFHSVFFDEPGSACNQQDPAKNIPLATKSKSRPPTRILPRRNLKHSGFILRKLNSTVLSLEIPKNCFLGPDGSAPPSA